MLSIIELGYSRINSRTSERTNRGVRTVRLCSVMFGWCNPQAIMLARLRRPFTAPPRKYQSRHKCPKGVLKICEQAPIFNLAFCTYGVRPLLRSAQSQRSGLFALFAPLFVRSAFSFQFSVFSSLISLQQKKVSPFGKTFSKSSS